MPASALLIHVGYTRNVTYALPPFPSHADDTALVQEESRFDNCWINHSKMSQPFLLLGLRGLHSSA